MTLNNPAINVLTESLFLEESKGVDLDNPIQKPHDTGVSLMIVKLTNLKPSHQLIAALARKCQP